MATDEFNYAKQLSEIGNLITVQSNGLPCLGSKNPEDLKAGIQQYKGYVAKISGLVSTLEKICPPHVIFEEHQEMIQEYKEYIQGLNLMWRSIDENKFTIDQEKMKLGEGTVDRSVKRLVETTRVIGGKLQ